MALTNILGIGLSVAALLASNQKWQKVEDQLSSIRDDMKDYKDALYEVRATTHRTTYAIRRIHKEECTSLT